MSRVRVAEPLVAGVGTLCALIAATTGVASASGEPALAVAPKCVINASPSAGSLLASAGSGFTPDDSIGLSAGKASGGATVAADGTFSTTMHAPTLAKAGPGAKQFTLTARDQTSGTGSASATFWVANLAFTTRPAVAKPTAVVHFRFSGFERGKVVYGHYLRGHKVVATHRFGRATGICGLLDAKARLFPARNPAPGKYKVQIDDSRRYHANALPRVSSPLTITPRRRPAAQVFPRAISRRSIALSYVSGSTPFSSATSRSIRPDEAASLTISAPLS
jgi:hypothetical protein